MLYVQTSLWYVDSVNDNNETVDKEYLTVEEAADLLRVHWQTVLEYIRTGQLEASKVGKSYRLTPLSIHAFLSERTTGLSLSTLKERIHNMLSAESLRGKRGIILSASFMPPAKLANLFESGDQSYVDLFRTPPTTRRMGWSFKTSQNDPRPVLGKYLEIKGGDVFRVRLYKNAHLLAYGSGQSEFLGWGVNKDAAGNQIEGPNVNALAVAELIYNYSSLTSEVIKRLGQPVKALTLHLYIYNPSATAVKNILSQANFAFPLNDYGTTVSEKELLLNAELEQTSFSPDMIAAALWKEYSHGFGLLDNEIAYLSSDKKSLSSSVFQEMR